MPVTAIRHLSVILAALLVTSATAADKKKVEPKKATTTAPAKDDKKGKKPPERRGPASFKDAPMLEDAEKEAIADKKRDEAIDSLKKIIPKIEDGSPQKAELLFQLSEMYWEKSKYLYRKEMTKYAAEEKKADEAKNRGEKVAEAKEDHRESELYRSETMRLYETILREYPAYDRKDEVLFSLGYNLYEIGKKDQAVKRYEELIKHYPGSKFVADTYVQLGNHYFDVANNLSRAKEMYEKAFASPNPKIKSYALYKLAWCDFNAGEHEKALKKLQDVVEFAEKQGKSMTDLKNEGLNDMVVMFVQLNRADDAMAYFKAHAGKKKQFQLTTRLAYQLADAGHHDSAIKTFRFMLAENAMAEQAPDYQQAIIKSYEGLRQRDKVKAEVRVLAELYRPGSAWWKANESKKEVLVNGFNVAEEAMRTIVTEYHQEAQRTKQVDTYRLARDIYKQYVDAFASSEDENFVSDFAYNLKFFYAEILWALEEWEAAAKQYDEVTAFKIPNRDTAKEASNESYRKSSAYNAILAHDKLVRIERGLLQKSELKQGDKVDETKKKGEVQKQAKIQKRSAKELEEQKLTKAEEKLVAACDNYIARYPNNAEEIDVRYQAAVIFYDRNHFVDAARRFGEIILKWPEEKRSQEAADLSMAVLEEKQEWLELNKLSRQFLANKKLAKAGTDFTKRTAAVVEGSQYKYVDEVIYKKEKNPKQAAGEFLKFVAEFPTSDNADRALTYAMIIFDEAGELDKVIETGERVLKEYPFTQFDLKVRYRLAVAYEKVANFEKSAEGYEGFIASYDESAGPKAIGFDNIKDLLKKEKETKEKEAKAAAKSKTTAKDAKGKDKPVIAAPRKFATKEKEEQFKKERDELVKEAEKWVADAQFNAALWWEGLGKSDKAIAAYSRYIARFKEKKDVPDIAFNIGLIHEKDKKWAEAIKVYDSFLTTYAKDTRVNDVKRIDAKYRQFLAYKLLKDASAMDKTAKEIAAMYPKLSDADKKSDRAMAAYAHVRFYQLEPTWNGYLAIKLNNVKTLKSDLQTKTKKTPEVLKAYTDVLAIGNGEYGIAALTRIGLMYADFAQNFLDSPDPKGLDEDQLSMYRGELENRAFPLEEKAIEALEKALAKSYELSVYNEWTILAQDRLNKYRPGAYAKVRDVPYRGSEFFIGGSLEKVIEKKPTQAPVNEPAKASPSVSSVSPVEG
ncbi:MAG: tetratricopeptide repeat protein [Myxococcaceae bacterium]|nr:tetratricopeptide repeat protein [Myxococcaceae bacterium]